MVNQIEIILEDSKSNKHKGNAFERLIRNILSIENYKIRGNINFTGMEIDLIAEHKYSKETLYVECKAKNKVSSTELRNFCFNTDFKEVDKGYFIRTKELESQAGGLLSEIKNKEKYRNLTFFEPDDVIDMLLSKGMVYENKNTLKSVKISKRILSVTYFGDYFIYLIDETNLYPTKFVVINANSNESDVKEDHISILKQKIPDIKSLELFKIIPDKKIKTDSKGDLLIEDIEAISEVQESEYWYDYLPASASKKHFVGRDEIRTKILTYFKDIRKEKSTKRIFYLNGKSGWGKSSLVLEIKERCKNKHYRKKFYTIAIDTRSATSPNFVALSFKKLIDSAINDQFINQGGLFDKKITFSSINDLLSSDSIISFLSKLKTENKFLILIFDQFEDVFRKPGFFKSFYKFLSDVTDKKPNLIIGFSWKSDFFVQSDDPSYYIWQQAKEQAREFTVNEFSEKEIEGIINQLENSVGRLDNSLKNRIKESSQGLPWLTKKLCIHILNQIEVGFNRESLLESNLNIIELFRQDEEKLSPKETKALKIIAKKAYDGDFFDETQVGELLESSTISNLLDKRLIIRSGTNYTIYWDIYRDYIVTGDAPIIGESYLLRQGVSLCLEVFLLFGKGEKKNLKNLLDNHPKDISPETLNNILIELRNLEIIQKSDENYYVSSGIEITETGFIDYISEKLTNYTPYSKLQELNRRKIYKSDVIEVLKDIFKRDFRESTWDSYAKNLIGWFKASHLDIKEKLVEPKRGRNIIKITAKEKNISLPRNSVKELLQQKEILLANSSLINGKFIRDFLLLEIINEDLTLTNKGIKFSVQSDEDAYQYLKELGLSLPKMKKLKKIVDNQPKIKTKELLKKAGSNFFEGKKESSKLIYASKAKTWLK